MNRGATKLKKNRGFEPTVVSEITPERTFLCVPDWFSGKPAQFLQGEFIVHLREGFSCFVMNHSVFNRRDRSFMAIHNLLSKDLHMQPETKKA